MSTRPLVVFTHYYPFGEMELFLETEMRYLQERFSHIVVIPNVISGPKRDTPEGIRIETAFADTYCGKGLLSMAKKTLISACSPQTYSELWKIPKKKAYIRKLLGYSYEATRCCRWLDNYLKKHPALHNAIFYTYWFFDHTTGISQLRKAYPGIGLITRAHGFDVYEEEYSPPFIPFRKHTLQSIDKLVLISNHGYQYMSSRFPEHANKMSVFRLGVEDPGFEVSPSASAAFTLVSCAHMIPLKRISLLIDGLAVFARQHPHLQLCWHHIGDGPLREDLSEQAQKQLPANVQWRLAGSMSNQEVHALYRKLNPHVFLLASETEGLPVSIMEAFSCGIPVIATSVGGVSEIVDGRNGLLLQAHPSPDEISRALAHVLLNPESREAMKKAARATWQERFHAKDNYRCFAEFISRG